MPAQVVVHVTDRCNLNCQHCLRDPARASNDLPVASFEAVLDQLAQYATDSVALTGGEPLLHPEFDRLLDAVVDRGWTWTVVTNASRFEHLEQLFVERPARRTSLRRINFSLDGATEETHDDIRGAGSFAEVMRAIAGCVAAEIPFTLQMAINRANRHEIEGFGLQAAQLGAASVRYSWTQPTATHHDARLRLEPREWVRVRDSVGRMKDVLRIPVDVAAGLPTTLRFVNCAVWSDLHPHVDMRGKYTLCCALAGTPEEGSLSNELGDVGETDFADAHAKMANLVNELRLRRIAEIKAGTLGKWDDMPCNWCAKQFGKPHWTDDGVGGAAAKRERWRGAWANGATGVRDASNRVRLRVLGDAE